MTEKKSISSEDTKDFVLYVYEQEKNSLEAWSKIKANPSFAHRCLVKNIRDMAEIPAFLLGVPCLFDVKKKQVSHGSQAIENIDTECKATFMPLSSSGSRKTGKNSMVRLPPSFQSPRTPQFEGKIDDDMLQQYMAARSQQPHP